MRISQVHSSDYGGGAEVVVRLHHQELLHQRYESRLFVARRHYHSEGTEEIGYVRGIKGSRRIARCLEYTLGYQNLYSPSFRALLQKLPSCSDIIHLHTLHGAEEYADLSRLAWLSKQCPVVLTLHDLWLLTGHCAHPMDCTRWLTGCGNCPDLQRYPSISRDGSRANWQRKQKVFTQSNVHLIVPSSWVQTQVKKSPILGHLPSSVIYNPVDTTLFFRKDRRSSRKKLRLPQDRKIVLLVAHQLNNVFKGVPRGIEALNLIEEPTLFVVVVGCDAKETLSRCRIPGKAIPYQANQGDLADFYRAADVLLMPSLCETFGMVAAESMACGTPVVAFSTGGLADVLGEDEGGVLVPKEDVKEMAASLQRLLESDERRQVLGYSAEARSHREFSLKKHTERCLEIYQMLVETFNRKSSFNQLVPTTTL